MSDNKASVFPQFLAGVVASIGAFSLGCVLGWSAPVQSEVQSGKLGFKVSDDDYSWIGSMVTLGGACACMPIGGLIKILGRKWTMMLLVIPFTIGWALLILAKNALMMIISRFILGLSGGGFCVAAPVYTTEIAQGHIRGILGSFYQLLLVFGILFVYVAGAFMDAVTLSVTCSVCPLVFAVLMLFMPESPMYLVSKGKNEAAGKALQWLRGGNYDTSAEMNDFVAQNAKMKDQNTNLLDALTRKATIKAFGLSLGMMFLQQFGGINAIIFYQTDIFEKANTGLSSDLCTIIVGIMQVIATLVAVAVIDKLGRRPLLLSSAFFDGLCTTFVGIYFWMMDRDANSVKSLNWLPVVSVVIFIIMFSFGMGPVPWLFAAEIFAPDCKDIAVSITGTCNWVMAFGVAKCFLPMRNLIGAGPAFWVFSVISILGAVYMFIFTPETKGKTFAEIQAELEG